MQYNQLHIQTRKFLNIKYKLGPHHACSNLYGERKVLFAVLRQPIPMHNKFIRKFHCILYADIGSNASSNAS